MTEDERSQQRQVTVAPEVLAEYEEVAEYLSMPVRTLLGEAVRRFHSSQDFENWLRRARDAQKSLEA